MHLSALTSVSKRNSGRLQQLKMVLCCILYVIAKRTHRKEQKKRKDMKGPLAIDERERKKDRKKP